MKSWYVYMVRCRDTSLYTGITTDLSVRLARHNAAQGAKYTRNRLPVVLVWNKKVSSESKARKKEAEIKTWPKAKKERLLQAFS
jgi:predicted GIY-YIG superfamily endonuclease